MRILRFISLIAAIAVILSISAFADAPVITGQPQNVFFPVNQEFPATAYFSVMATGDNLSYQWQSSRNNGETWVNVDSATATSANFRFQYSENTIGNRLFRCVVSSSEGTVVSQVVTVSVGGYLMQSIGQMVTWSGEIINNIFDWIGTACACIIDTPLLLIGVSFFALGASIAILSRLLSRS